MPVPAASPARSALPATLASARRWLNEGLRQVPSQCAVCRRWPSQPVCTDCMNRFAAPLARCPGCALDWTALPGGPPWCPDCLREPLPLARCEAAVNYSFPWSDLLGGLKFREQTGWTDFFARLLLQRPGVRTLMAGLGPQDRVLPLPLSAERLAERGFNQAWELAKALHRESRCQAALDASTLLRLRHTPRQSELGRAQRLLNVKGAFAVDPLRTATVAGRRAVLVDDVMTSGASISAAAQALRAAGAAEVSAIVVARTPP